MWQHNFVIYSLLDYMIIFIIASLFLSISDLAVSISAWITGVIITPILAYRAIRDQETVDITMKLFIMGITLLVISIILDLIILVWLFEIGVDYYTWKVFAYYIMTIPLCLAGKLIFDKKQV